MNVFIDGDSLCVLKPDGCESEPRLLDRRSSLLFYRAAMGGGEGESRNDTWISTAWVVMSMGGDGGG